MIDCRLRFLILIALSLVLLRPCGLASQPPSESAHDLIKDVVYNDLQDRGHQSFWEYRIEKCIAQQSLTEEQVETQYGPVYRVIAKNGVPLDQSQQQQDDSRLDALLHDPGEQEKLKNNYEKDEQRLERLMGSCPTPSFASTTSKMAATFGSGSAQILHSIPLRTRHASFTDSAGRC